ARRVIENGERVVDVARDIGRSKSAVNNWKKAKEKALEEELEKHREKKRCEQIEEENRDLLEENKLLKSDLLSLRRLFKSELRGE
ncbi:MAG TPA: transposase, partial [Halomonas sp.]|nr:transposase [Halomonas sp.]